MNRYEQRRLKLLARLSEGPAILDVGCAAQPNRQLRGARVVGLDLAEMPVEPPYTEHWVTPAEQVADRAGGERFQTVIMGEFIEHVERPYDVLRAMRAVIAPGGRLVLSTPNPVGVPLCWVERLGWRGRFYSADHRWLLTPRWVWRMLETCGYRLRATRGCGIWLMGHALPAPPGLSYLVAYVAEPV